MAKMNYIKRMQAEKRADAAELTGLQCGLSDLIQYLSSSKFYEDTTVQTADVIRRIAEFRAHAYDLRLDQQRIDGI